MNKVTPWAGFVVLIGSLSRLVLLSLAVGLIAWFALAWYRYHPHMPWKDTLPLLREMLPVFQQGFSAAADAASRYVPAGELNRAADAISDEMLDTIAIAGNADHCRQQLAQFDGVVDQALFVNVNYSGDSEAATLAAFDALIGLATEG